METDNNGPMSDYFLNNRILIQIFKSNTYVFNFMIFFEVLVKQSIVIIKVINLVNEMYKSVKDIENFILNLTTIKLIKILHPMK